LDHPAVDLARILGDVEIDFHLPDLVAEYHGAGGNPTASAELVERLLVMGLEAVLARGPQASSPARYDRVRRCWRRWQGRKSASLQKDRFDLGFDPLQSSR
ncbi:MAG: hypothetical protein ACRCZF_23245, partial [Gemmataceae bacterium]